MPNLTLNDVALHYQCLGEGEDVVLIHGLGANLAFWYLGIASVLARHYRVTVYDLRGHGESSMPFSGYTLPCLTEDLQHLLQHLDIKRTHLVGHSFGGVLALHYAASHPDRVATLTLADPQISCLQPKLRLGDWSYWKIWKQQLEQQGVPLPSDDDWIGMRLLSRLSELSRGSLSAGASSAPHRPSLKRRTMGNRGAQRWEQLLNTTLAEQELNDTGQITTEDIRRIEMPTLAIYGEYSHCLPCCWELKNLISNCQTVVVPEVGHFHPVVKPDRFLDALQTFLAAHSHSNSMVIEELTHEEY